MAVGNINDSLVSSAAMPSTGKTSSADDGLGKDAFLKLLIAELSNQDPLDPMEDREFIAQMAQFSSLEQMQNMNKTLTSMADATKFNAVSYVGKSVSFPSEITDDEGKTSYSGQAVAGVVNAVWFDPDKGTILDTTAGEVPLEIVTGVSDTDSASKA